MLTVVCMKWGTAYGPDYVNTLHAMVARNLSLPFRFVCLTDDPAGLISEVEARPLPEIHVPAKNDISPWRKVALFRPDLLGEGAAGRGLFLDLDVVITGRLDEIAAYAPGQIAMAENWTQKGQGIGNSSVFTFEIGQFGYIFDTYNNTQDTIFDTYSNEQTFVSKTAAAEGHFTYFPKEWVRSFKEDCMPWGPLNWVRTPDLPAGAKVIAFHGNPKPPDAARGVYPGKWYKTVRPTPWVAQHWTPR